MAKDKDNKEKTAEGEETPAKKRGKKTLIIPLVVMLVGLGAGGYFFFGKKEKAAADPHAPTTVALGAVVRLEPITMNLSDGHVLKVGIALQTVKEPKEEHMKTALAAGGHGKKADPESPLGGEEAKAINAAISVLGHSSYAELSKSEGRAKAQKELVEHVKETYHGDVTDVYFTAFVMS